MANQGKRKNNNSGQRGRQELTQERTEFRNGMAAALAETRDDLRDLGQSGMHLVAETRHALQQQGMQACETVEEMVSAKPWTSLFMALGAGVLIGWMTRR